MKYYFKINELCIGQVIDDTIIMSIDYDWNNELLAITVNNNNDIITYNVTFNRLQNLPLKFGLITNEGRKNYYKKRVQIYYAASNLLRNHDYMDIYRCGSDYKGITIIEYSAKDAKYLDMCGVCPIIDIASYEQITR